MTSAELKFNTRFRNNSLLWMMCFYLECGISSNDSVQEAEAHVLISNSLGVSARSQYKSLKFFKDPGLAIALFFVLHPEPTKLMRSSRRTTSDFRLHLCVTPFWEKKFTVAFSYCSTASEL